MSPYVPFALMYGRVPQDPLPHRLSLAIIYAIAELVRRPHA